MNSTEVRGQRQQDLSCILIYALEPEVSNASGADHHGR
jgi:hypothetical protein